MDAMHWREDNTAAVVRRLIGFLVAATILAVGIVARADTIRLHDQMAAPGPQITLRDVAELDGRLAEFYADTPVADFGEGRHAVVTLDRVRQILDAQRINWGLVSLSGYASCRVTRLQPPAPAPGLEGDAAETPSIAVAANVEDEVTLDSATSLKTLVLDKLSQFAAAPPSELRVAFSERDERALRRSVVGQRFEVEPRSISGIGRVPLTIRRYEGEDVVETIQVTADVEKRCLAVVVKHGVSRGDMFTRDSVEVREVWRRDDRAQPLSDPKLVINQVAAAQLRPGAVVLASHVESPMLVRRGELITVRCITGGLVVRTVGRAAEDGGMDDLIQVRNETTRQNYIATVTGPREASIQLDGGNATAGTSANLAIQTQGEAK